MAQACYKILVLEIIILVARFFGTSALTFLSKTVCKKDFELHFDVVDEFLQLLLTNFIVW